VAHGRPPAGRRIRRILLGARPLDRMSDRLQVLARVLLLATLLASAPIALSVAVRTYSDTHRQAVAQAAERHQVPATLVADAPIMGQGSDQAVTRSRAMAVWTGASGQQQQGSVVVPAGTVAGSTVRVWLDRAGRVADTPLTDDDAVTRAVGYALVTALLVATGAVAAYGAVLMALERSRARSWAAEWADVEPLWTRQSS
jgi:hypothetical protein